MSTFAAGSSSSSAKIAHSPSAVEEDSVDRILRSAYDAQYLRASKELALLEDLMNPQNEYYCGDAESHRLRLKLDLYSSAVKQIKDRASKVLHTLQQELSIRTGGSDWIYGTKHFGITTYYQVAEDGCITVRMEGGLDNLPFFEQAAVIHDIDSFKHWVPFCEDSRMLEKVSLGIKKKDC